MCHPKETRLKQANKQTTTNNNKKILECEKMDYL